jgi:hypothetical protein
MYIVNECNNNNNNNNNNNCHCCYKNNLLWLCLFLFFSLFLETVSLLYGINIYISMYDAVLMLDRQ